MTEKLPKVVARKKKRRGRGYGSGKGGHTTGRGQKGQKSRTKIGILFEGVKVKKSLIKRLPLHRGKGRFKAKAKPLVVKLSYLNLLPSGTKVDITALVKFGIVKRDDAERYGVKILGDGKLTKKLIISLPISNSAAKKVEKAGGKITKKE
ncbi:MAG: uL15m family ribosomal protein [Microgenomates group bacterium]